MADNNDVGFERSKMLIESLPYMREFQSKTFVIKYGGSTMKEMIRRDIIQDLILLKTIGINPVVVHGGGAEITNYLTKLNIETKFVNGLRVTSKEAIEVAQMVLVGKVNQKIVASINQDGGKAIGLSGVDCDLIIAKKKQAVQIFEQDKCTATVDLGFVGDVKKVNPEIITSLVNAGFIPVISPIGIGPDGESYNINADEAAGYVAHALKAEKLIMLTDVDGIYADPNDKSSKVEALTISKAKEMIAATQIKGGMIPKVNACIHAIKNGVHAAHIIDGGQLHSILLEVFTDKGTGTMVIA